MEGFAKSKDVHRTLIRVFDSWFKEIGFRRNRSDKCAYFRSDGPASGTFSAFEVQCSQFAQDWTGGDFTLNGARGVKDVKYLGGPHSRLLCFIDESDLPEALEIQARIAGRMPDLPADHPVRTFAERPDPEGAQWRDRIAHRRDPPIFQWEPGNDHWCNYFSVEDVREWGRFLLPRILPLLDRIPPVPD
ncbi:MAG: hypothetical protein ACLQIB_31975 [Isosphaeraceae bacterium]